MPREAKRRFLGLTVGEVSLVDSPANEVEFLVTKNLEEDDMALKNEDAGSERVPVEQETTGGADVAKALEHVNGIVDKIADIVTKKSGEPAAPASEPAAPAAPAADEDVEKGASLKSYLKRAGMSMTDEQMAKLKAMGLDPNAKFQNQQAPLAKTSKDAAEAAPAAETTKAAEDEPLTMDTLTRIAKGGKVFTKSRVESLKAAHEILKLLIEAIEPDATPATRTPALGATSFPSSVQKAEQPQAPVEKSEDAAVVKALEGVTKALEKVGAGYEALKTEVDTLKNARPPSASVDGEGGTDTKTTKNGSMWSGVL